MKIAFTITNFGAAANIGGDPEKETYIVEVPDSLIPVPIQNHIESPTERKWQTLSLSLVMEEIGYPK